MPWAQAEPSPLVEKVGLLRRFRGQFDLGQDFVYGIFERDESAVVGGSGLHTRSRDSALEIGYWIRASHTGQGLATETTAALTRVAIQVCGVDRVDIRVDPENEASIGIPRKLGYVEEATLRRRLPGNREGELRDATLFSLFRDDFAETPAASAELQAYDALGAQVL